jgi:O-antigen/teichoic acid export membrane protein
VRLGWNLIAALGNSGWTALVNVLATPFYLHFLGAEAYGLVGFFITLMTLLAVLDLGLAPTMSREVARYAELGGVGEAAKLLATLERIYWIVAIAIALIFFLAANWIGHHWLHSDHLAPTEITRAVMLMGVAGGARWPVALYSGTLLGAQRLLLLSRTNIAVVTATAVGAIALLRWVSPSINVFFLWQAVIGVCNVMLMRWCAWGALGRRASHRFDFTELRRIWRFSAGLSALAMTGAFLLQLDKLLLSKLVTLGAYGRYSIASLLAGGLYLLVTPMYNVLYPRFSALVAIGQESQLASLYGISTRLMATLVFPVAMVVVLFAQPLLRVWTHNPELAAQIAPVLVLLIMGSALHGVMYLPYALQLAYGNTRLPLFINGILIVFYIPLIITLSLRYAEMGAAVAWLLLHVFYVGVGTWLTHRYYLKRRAMRWLIADVSIPLAVALLVGEGVRNLPGYPALADATLPILVMYAGASGGAALIISLLLSPSLRLALRNHFRFSEDWP